MNPVCLCIGLLVCLLGGTVQAQGPGYLQKNIALTVQRQPLSDVLVQIGQQGGFFFSYNTGIIPGDSLVTFSTQSATVRNVLDQLFLRPVHYRETDGYLILLPGTAPEKYVAVTGQIRDAGSGEGIDYASVYSATLRVSALSDDQGNFRLRLRERQLPLELIVGKVGYKDTTFLLQHAPAELSLSLSQQFIELDEITVTNPSGLRKLLANFMIPARLRRNSLNLGRFFVDLPYQVSLTPGLGSHGRMTAQIVNRFSLNLIGGYTGGTNGLEMAGGFNITKNNIQGLQVAGLFNAVSGSGAGAQLAGLYNTLGSTLTGLQLAGISNFTSGEATGMQAAAILNNAGSGLNGIQVSGAVNLIRESARGVQLAACYNRSYSDFSGVQISGLINSTKGSFSGLQMGIFNHAGHLKGVQIGLINRVGATDGQSLGLINLIPGGRSHLSLATSDIVPVQLTWKTGKRHFYTLLHTGASFALDRVAWGAGIGYEYPLGGRLRGQIEASSNGYYDTGWQRPVSYGRLFFPLNLLLNDQVTFFAGPALSYQYGPAPEPKNGESVSWQGSSRLRAGWQGGISWYYGKSARL